MTGHPRPGPSGPARPLVGVALLAASLAAGILLAGARPDPLAAQAVTAGTTPRPNLVLIVADDLGYGDVSAYGGDIPTPRIDQLAAGGIRFDSGYVTAPVCNPSRAALMSGRYQQRWGQEENEQGEAPEGAPRGSLPRSQTTLGAQLRARGYRTAAIGKWHLGMQPGYHPLDRGFDEFFGLAAGGTNYVDRSWPGIHTFDALGQFDSGEPPLDESAFFNSPGRGLVRGRDPARLERYFTEQLTAEAVAFIERSRSEPFVLYLAFNAPHAPLETTDPYYRRFPQFADERKRIYAAMISALDDGVGRVVDALRDAGLEQRTLVLFVSDNGAAEYIDADGKRNAPFAGHKRNLYEGGIRLPFIARWPERLAAGKVYAPMVSTLDLMPTLLAAAGASDEPRAPAATAEGGAAPAAPPFDGVDLLPFLDRERAQGGRAPGDHAPGERGSQPHQALFWRTGPNGAIRRGDWKLLIARQDGSGEEIVRLYDLAHDRGETRDLAREHPDLVKELRAAWTQWNAGLLAPRRSARTAITHHLGDSIRWDI